MPHKYTQIAKWFHWFVVFLVGLELLVAAVMPGVHRNTTPGTLVNLHFSFGVIIIVVMVLRLLWRLTHSVPALPKGTPRLEAVAAHVMHLLLYLLLFLIPFAGWTWANALGWKVTLFGLPMPTLVPKGWIYIWLVADAHVYLAGGIIVLIGLHILASLWHWYFKKDNVLERMLPEDKFTVRVLAYFNRFR